MNIQDAIVNTLETIEALTSEGSNLPVPDQLVETAFNHALALLTALQALDSAVKEYQRTI